jgi:hypothetical protein
MSDVWMGRGEKVLEEEEVGGGREEERATRRRGEGYLWVGSSD